MIIGVMSRQSDPSSQVPSRKLKHDRNTIHERAKATEVALNESKSALRQHEKEKDILLEQNEILEEKSRDKRDKAKSSKRKFSRLFAKDFVI